MTLPEGYTVAVGPLEFEVATGLPWEQVSWRHVVGWAQSHGYETDDVFGTDGFTAVRAQSVEALAAEWWMCGSPGYFPPRLPPT